MAPERRWTIHGPAAVIVVTALLAMAAWSIRHAPETYPWGDTAATSIYTLRAASGELGTGAYSRFQWNHPGPLLYQVLSPLYALSGYREISIKWTTLLLNVTVLAALFLVVWRHAPALAVTVALALAPLLYREQRLLFWAWNPIAPLLTFALAIALAAGLSSGRFAFLPLLAAATSFMTQAHVAFAPVSVVIVGLSLAILAWRLRTDERALDRRSVLGSLLATLLVVAALWAVPLLHELNDNPGNMAAIVNFFQSAPREPRDWSTIAGIFANQFVGPYAPAWELTASVAPDNAPWPVMAGTVALLGLLLAAAIRAARRRAVFEASVATICLALSLAGLLAIRSVIGPVSDYLITWVAVTGALTCAAVTAELLHWLQWPVAPASRSWPLALVAYLCVVAAAGSVRLMGKHAFDARSNVIRTITDRLGSYCREHRIERPLLRFTWAGWEGASGVLLQYYKQGRPIAVPADLVYLVGPPFQATGDEAGEFYLMNETESVLPDGVTRHEWVMTHGSFRLIRLFRNSASSQTTR